MVTSGGTPISHILPFTKAFISFTPHTHHVDCDPQSAAKTPPAAGAPATTSDCPTIEITLARSDAGSLVLSRIKDDVAEGSISLRDAVDQIFRAMQIALSSESSTGASRSQFRGQYPSSVYMRILRTQSGPALMVLDGEIKRSEYPVNYGPKSRGQ